MGWSDATHRRKSRSRFANTEHTPPPADAAPYGVYLADGGQPPGVTQVDNTLATMGRGQWLCNETDRVFSFLENGK
jgi:hypothetical protein